MRAVNLLTPDLRSAPKGKGAPGPSAMETPGGIGAIRGPRGPGPVRRGRWPATSSPTTSSSSARLSSRRSRTKADATRAEAAKLKPYADFQSVAQRARRHRAGARRAPASTGSRRCATSPARCPRTSPSARSTAVWAGRPPAAPRCAGRSPRPAIELKGCTKSQPAVASLMSRLRNVQGVTRVALAKSDKDSIASASGSTVNPCGKGAPPASRWSSSSRSPPLPPRSPGRPARRPPRRAAHPGPALVPARQSSQSTGQAQGGDKSASGQATNSSTTTSTGGAK